MTFNFNQDELGCVRVASSLEASGVAFLQRNPRTLMDTHPVPCEPEVLVRTPVVCIERCRTCGAYSLHFGATTIRFDADAAHLLSEALASALRHVPSAEPASTWFDGARGSA
jgi:hypothetical protein